MSPLQAILSFTLASSLLTMTPGIDTALVLRTATVKGQRDAFAVILGTALGCILWCTLVSLGLGALLLLSEVFYELLRLGGACYLLYLGTQMILKAKSHRLDIDSGIATSATTCEQTRNQPHRQKRHYFYQGLLNNLLNPKVGMFYLTFLPQFIPQGASIASFGILLGFIHATEGLIWFSLLTLLTRPIAGWLKRPQIIAALDRLTGGILIAFGLKLALEPRQVIQ